METHDQIEVALRDMRDALTNAWRGNRCLSCPLAELSALASATLTFYLESKQVVR